MKLTLNGSFEWNSSFLEFFELNFQNFKFFIAQKKKKKKKKFKNKSTENSFFQVYNLKQG